MSDVNDKWTVHLHGSGMRDRYVRVVDPVFLPRVDELVRIDGESVNVYRKVIVVIHDYVSSIVHVETSQH